MKAVQKARISPDSAFAVQHLHAPHFDHNWHFHAEYQLFVVLEGTGTRFIGDHVEPFAPGDLVFTGPDLPHLWRSDPEYFEGDRGRQTEGVVIYFHEDLLGAALLSKNESLRIRQLLTRSTRGIQFTGATQQEASRRMQELPQLRDFDRVLALLQLLNLLSHSDNYRLLAGAGYTNALKAEDTERMNSVHAYVMQHFREKISLDAAAALANMTPTSFSRYFRTHANKTFSDFLSEIRIGYACKLLLEKEMDVAQIAYESGFQTLSNFNRQFRALTSYSPLAYRRAYSESGYPAQGIPRTKD
ncbi:AraC family transcriptional regulator [Chitinophaga rhizosphaerae]|uniref:AraC family transcriptional regulator n=1 Tax=Chitinophaga rhizosphaerae TaxID=1864947 RepID=UPI000F805F4F|nr:AraC family transcriptional regulator [Chitinophaga rhizosphaerae]